MFKVTIEFVSSYAEAADFLRTHKDACGKSASTAKIEPAPKQKGKRTAEQMGRLRVKRAKLRANKKAAKAARELEAVNLNAQQNEAENVNAQE